MRRIMLVLVLALGLVAPAAAQDDEPGYFFNVPKYELEPVDVPEAGVSLSWPVDWEMEVPVLKAQHRLPAGYDVEDPTAWILIRGMSDAGDWCRLTSFDDHPMSLEEQAAYGRDSAIRDGSDEDRVDTSSWMVGGEFAQRTTETAGDYQTTQTYLFETGGVRYDLTCYSFFGENPSWQEMADSVEPLGAQPEPTEPEPGTPSGESQVIDLPAAGVELALPADWTFTPGVEDVGGLMPPPYDELGHVAQLRALQATGSDDLWCNVYAYDQMPWSLDEHAEYFASQVRDSAELPGTVETDPVTLPIGESVRLVETYDHGEVHVIYLFDLDGARRYLVCGGRALPDDAWLSVAETIAPMVGPLPDFPDDAVDWSEVNDVVTQLPVPSADEGETYMHAACARAIWFELSDGSYQEGLSCRLTDDPVEDQGQLPAESVTLGGGACEWVSDFWAETDGSEYWAASWSVTVEPDGSAQATSHYAAEELDCEG